MDFYGWSIDMEGDEVQLWFTDALGDGWEYLMEPQDAIDLGTALLRIGKNNLNEESV